MFRLMAPTSTKARQGAVPTYYRVALALVIVINVANSSLAIVQDTHTTFEDSGEYFHWSHRISNDLRGGSLGSALSVWWNNDERLPLGIIPAVVAQTLAGGASPVAARLSNLFWLALLLLLTFLLGRRLHSPEAGLLAAAALGATPMIMGHSRLILMDLALATVTTAAVYALFRTEHFDRIRASALFGLACGLGFLCKHSFPIFVAPMAVVYLALSYRRSRRRRRTVTLAVMSALMGLASFGLWASSRAESVHHSFNLATIQDRSLVSEMVQRVFDYSHALLHTMLGIPLTVAVAASLVLLLLAGQRRILFYMLLWFFGSMLLLCFFVSWSRYLLPAIPAVGLCLGAGLCCVPRFMRYRAWTVPAALCLLVFLPIQQTWFGPNFSWCEHLGVGGRFHCAGMIRPHTVNPRRPEMKLLVTRRAKQCYREAHELMHIVALPARFSLDSVPPMDNSRAAFQQWVAEDADVPVETVDDLEVIGVESNIDFAYLFAVFSPGPREEASAEVRSLLSRARKMLKKNSGRWERVLVHRFPSGAGLVVYRNERAVICQ